MGGRTKKKEMIQKGDTNVKGRQRCSEVRKQW